MNSIGSTLQGPDNQKSQIDAVFKPMRRSDESLHLTWYLRLRLLDSDSRHSRFVLDEKKVVWGSGSQSGDGRKILSNNNGPFCCPQAHLAIWVDWGSVSLIEELQMTWYSL
jgi:hypothetical protein